MQEVVKKTRPDDLATRERALLDHIRDRAEFLWDGWVRHEHRWELAPLTACADRWLERDGDDGPWLAYRVAGPLQHLGNFAAAERLNRARRRADASRQPQLRSLPQQPGVVAPGHQPTWPRPSRCSGGRWRSDEKSLRPRPSPTSPPPSTTWRSCFRPPTAWPRPSRCSGGRWRSTRRRYGPDHPDVATDLNNLAVLLQATNRLAEAEPLFRRALAIDEASYGPDHPDVATDLNNLAALLQATNRLAEAEPLFRRALAIDEASLRPRPPRRRHRPQQPGGVAAGHQPPGRGRAAATGGRWRSTRQSYGPDHPDVATDLNNLAGLLQATNRLAEAEPLHTGGRWRSCSSSPARDRPRASLTSARPSTTTPGCSRRWAGARRRSRRGSEEMQRRFGVSLVRGAYSGQEPRPGGSVLGALGQLARKLFGR